MVSVSIYIYIYIHTRTYLHTYIYIYMYMVVSPPSKKEKRHPPTHNTHPESESEEDALCCAVLLLLYQLVSCKTKTPSKPGCDSTNVHITCDRCTAGCIMVQQKPKPRRNEQTYLVQQTNDDNRDRMHHDDASFVFFPHAVLCVCVCVPPNNNVGAPHP